MPSLHDFTFLEIPVSSKKEKPREFFSSQEVFLITEKRDNFQAILLHANQEEWIKLKSKRFGVVKHIEENGIGKRIFHFRVYEVKSDIIKPDAFQELTVKDIFHLNIKMSFIWDTLLFRL